MGGEDQYVAFFNPRITSHSKDSVEMEEGCLSFMDLFLKIKRYGEVFVEYEDYTGTTKTAHYTGLTARVFQHELDHMNGIVYHSHVKPLALQMANKKRTKIKTLRKKYEQAMVKKVKAEFNAKKL
jgi:peptide deformylase